MQTDATTTFEPPPRNPKVIGRTKALVEAVDEKVEIGEKTASER
jgi:hypothetical protein